MLFVDGRFLFSREFAYSHITGTREGEEKEKFVALGGIRFLILPRTVRGLFHNMVRSSGMCVISHQFFISKRQFWTWVSIYV